MAGIWHFEQNGKDYGPFSSEQLKDMASSGQLHLADTVWKEGLDKRVPASKVRYLFDTAQLTSSVVTREPAVVSHAVAQRPPPESGSAFAETAARDFPAEENEAGIDPLAFPDDAGLIPLDGETPPPVAAAPTPPPETQAKQSSATKTEPRRRKPETRKKRVVSVKGATLMGQDGQKMKIRKKCLKCNHDDTSVVSIPIPSGSMRVGFYCPKCRKNQMVEIQGAG